jgi:hypothetical protein
LGRRGAGALDGRCGGQPASRDQDRARAMQATALNATHRWRRSEPRMCRPPPGTGTGRRARWPCTWATGQTESGPPSGAVAGVKGFGGVSWVRGTGAGEVVCQIPSLLIISNGNQKGADVIINRACGQPPGSRRPTLRGGRVELEANAGSRCSDPRICCERAPSPRAQGRRRRSTGAPPRPCLGIQAKRRRPRLARAQARGTGGATASASCKSTSPLGCEWRWLQCCTRFALLTRQREVVELVRRHGGGWSSGLRRVGEEWVRGRSLWVSLGG